MPMPDSTNFLLYSFKHYTSYHSFPIATVHKYTKFSTRVGTIVD